MSCSTDVTAPEISLLGLPPGVGLFYRLDAGKATANFSNMPVGSAVDVTAFVCIVFDASTTQCSTATVDVPPDSGHAVYPTSISVDACRVGESPSLSVAGSTDDWSAKWSLRDEDDHPTTDFGDMRTARVTVSFGHDLAGIDDWTSDTTTCSGAPDPDPEPSITPSPSPTP